MAKRTELMKQLLRYDLLTMHREKLNFPKNGLRELMSCFSASDLSMEETGEILERMICAYPDRKSVCEIAQLMEGVNLTDHLLRKDYVVPKEGGGYKLEGFAGRWTVFLENLHVDSRNIIMRADHLEPLTEREQPANINRFRTFLDAFSHLEFIMEKLWDAQVDRQYSDKSFSLEVPMVYYEGLYRRLAKDLGKALLYMTELGDARARPIFVGLSSMDMHSLWEICLDEEKRGVSGKQAVAPRELLGKIAEEGFHYQVGPCRAMMASFDWEDELDNWEKVLLVAQTQRMRRMGVEGAGIMIHKLLKQEKSHFGLSGLMLRVTRGMVKRGEWVALWQVESLEEYFTRIVEQIDLELEEDHYAQPEYYDTRKIYALYLDWIAEMRAAVAPEAPAAPEESEQPQKTEPLSVEDAIMAELKRREGAAQSEPVKSEPVKSEPVKSEPKPAPVPKPTPKPAPKAEPKSVPKAEPQSAPKPAEKKPEKQEEKKPEKPVSRPLAFLKGGVAIALLLFALFAPAAAFLWTEEAMGIVKIAVIVICAILGAIIGGFSGFFSGGIGGAVVMWVLPYFVELDVLVKIVLVLVLGGFGLYQLINALTAEKKKKP